ncbi:hypothetical protein TWF718_003328 [Orbilia javanica]|uniref:F-box domain-containing protein n=1 Tax=Orbilia javanica TaxID=47235 RepID=A0AAN8MGB8_9PEZI
MSPEPFETPAPPTAIAKGLDTLPAAILERIFELLPLHSLKPLRLTNNNIKTITTPILFRTVTISTDVKDSTILRSDTKSLDVLFENIRELVILHPSSRASYNSGDGGVDINPLQSFISNIKSLNSLHYPLPSPLLSPLPSLKSLTFTSHPSFTILDFLTSLPPPLPQITSLTLKNTPSDTVFNSLQPTYLQTLTSLTLTTPPQTTTQSSPSSSSKKKLKSLVKTLTNVKQPFSETVYDHLRKNSIFPTFLNVQSQSVNLIFFLLAYPAPSQETLKTLEITLDPYLSKHTSRIIEFVDAFWEWTVGNHRYTLKRLKFYPSIQPTSSSSSTKTKKIKKIHQTLLTSTLFDFRFPHKDSLKKLENLKHLELGGLENEGFYELIEFVILELSGADGNTNRIKDNKNSVSHVVWHFYGLDHDDETIDDKQRKEVKRFVKSMRWKSKSGGGSTKLDVVVTIIPGAKEKKMTQEGREREREN